MGPLKGIKIIEIAGIGPGPFAGMLLADMGAEVIRVERPSGGTLYAEENVRYDLLNRGKRCIGIDLKNPAGIETLLKLIENAQGLIEGFRPGVMERLGLGPEVCLQRNPKLLFGRMTGWGQDGPLAQRSGHDINYISIAGVLGAIGNKGEKPAIPLNLVGDFGGGGMMLAYGMVCGILETQFSGKGQVIDCSMVEGSAILMSTLYSAQQLGFWREQRGSNMLDSGSHFYNTYQTADGEYISVGSFESKFYHELLAKLELTDAELPHQLDESQWDAMSEKLANIFSSKTRDEWCEIFADSDACFTPVLKISEAYDHPHNVARDTFVEIEQVKQPRPAPRFSRTDNKNIQRPPAVIGQHTDEILSELGLQTVDIDALRAAGAIL